jgi:hypothetical protein
MEEFQPRVVIQRDPANPPASGNRLTQAAANAKVSAEQIKQRRKEIHQQAKADLSNAPGQNAPEEMPTEPVPVRENLTSIEFTAPNGLEIVYGPRTDISLSDRIARMFSGRDYSLAEFRITRVLMGVISVNGVPPQTIVDEITRTKLANQIGDEAIDLLLYYDRVHWPPLQAAELPVLKKNYRT